MKRFSKDIGYINLILLLRIIGYLLVIESLFMLIPIITGLLYKEPATIRFFGATLITGISGAGMMFLKPKSREMHKRDAVVLTGFTWIILSLFGMLPFLFCGTHFSITDAFLETMSGFTTTGISVLPTLQGVPKSILIWRSVVQWIGGLGIILFTLAVVPMLNNAGGMQLFNAEVTGITHDKLRPRVSFTAKGLWLIYIVLTAILIVLLSFSRMDLFEAVCHGLSTMSTGGFSTSDLSIAQWDSVYIKTVFCIFMFLGGVNFSLMYNAITGRNVKIWKNTAFKWYLWMILLCTIGFSINIFIASSRYTAESLILDPLFQTISFISSTGLVDPDFKNWGSLSTVLLLILIISGACAGSTSGGVKIDRLVVLVKFLKNEFYKMMHPSAVTTVTINGKGTNQTIVNKTLAFLFLYGIVIIVGGLILSLLGMPLSQAIFATLAAISNMGLETDIAGSSTHIAEINDLSKWILSFIMLIGRLELFTILLLLNPSFWKK